MTVDAEMAADFARLGAAVMEQEEDDVFEIWDINAPAFEAFLAIETQWRVVALSGFAAAKVLWTGLDYTAVDVVLRRRRLDDQVFDDICIMEQAVLDAQNGAAE